MHIHESNKRFQEKMREIKEMKKARRIVFAVPLLDLIMFMVVFSLIVSLVSWAISFFEPEVAGGFLRYGILTGFILAVLTAVSKIRSETKESWRWSELKELCLEKALTMDAYEEWNSRDCPGPDKLADFPL